MSVVDIGHGYVAAHGEDGGVHAYACYVHRESRKRALEHIGYENGLGLDKVASVFCNTRLDKVADVGTALSCIICMMSCLNQRREEVP